MTHIRIKKTQQTTAKRTGPQPVFYQYAGARVVALARDWCHDNKLIVPYYLDIESLETYDRALILADVIKANFRTRGHTDDPRIVHMESQADDLIHWLTSYYKHMSGQKSDWRYVAEHAVACANRPMTW